MTPPASNKTKNRLGLVAMSLALALLLFGTAGSLSWWQAWVYLGLYAVTIAALTETTLNTSPELVEERAKAGKLAPRWDRILVMLMTLPLPVMLLVSALDRRFGWSPAIGTLPVALAFVAILLGNLLTLQAMRSNPFFSSHVRIQSDRGHTVISDGPYRYLRHPGYTGSLLFNLATPIALGSWWALSAGLVFLVACLLRTAKEDRLLRRELEGYQAYADQVRFRLVPLVW